MNGDGLSEVLIGGMAYPNVDRRPEWKSGEVAYVVFGKRGRVEDVVLGNVSSLSLYGLKIEGGGGFIVSGIEDVNHDGYDDVMITSCLNYASKSNAYMVRYPLSMTSAPSVYPSSSPSSFPSSVPSQQPSSSHPSVEAASSEPSGVPSLMGSGRPEQPAVPSPTMLPSRRPSFLPSYRPTKSNAPVMLESSCPSVSPFISPTHFPTRIKTKIPSSSSPSSKRPNRFPTVFYSSMPTVISRDPSPPPASLLLPLSEYRVRSVNSSSMDREGIVYGLEGENEIFQISSMSGDGKRRSGWSGTVIGGGGRKVYVIYPKDASQPVNRIILKDFDSCCDVLDLSHFSAMSSQSDLSYLTHPLTIFLPDNQKIVLSRYLTMSSLSYNNFIFRDDDTTSTSSDISKRLFMKASLLLPLGLLVLCFAGTYFLVLADKGEENAKHPRKEVHTSLPEANQRRELETAEQFLNNFECSSSTISNNLVVTTLLPEDDQESSLSSLDSNFFLTDEMNDVASDKSSESLSVLSASTASMTNINNKSKISQPFNLET